MTPREFIEKWKPVALTERAAAQAHFLDLCRLLDHPTRFRTIRSASGSAFEKGVTKTGGGEGFADVWKQGFFAWEYKKKKRDLNAALEQLVRYAAALENPPLQVACDTDRFLIRTAWTNAVPKTYELSLDDLADPQKLDILRCGLLRPGEAPPEGDARRASPKRRPTSSRPLRYAYRGATRRRTSPTSSTSSFSVSSPIA